MRFAVQRSVDGGDSWWSVTGDDDPQVAEALCSQRFERAERHHRFRVVDVAFGAVLFEVANS